jgi:hypothetical protein
VLPDNTNLDVTPVVTGPASSYYSFNVTATEYHLIHQCVATYPPDQSRLTLGVGEQVNFYFDPPLPTNVTWGGGSAGTFVPSTGSNSTFTVTNVNAGKRVITATLEGRQEEDRRLRVSPPSNILFVSNNGVPYHDSQPPAPLPPDIGTAGAQTGFAIRVFPTNVSFAFLQFLELPGPPSNLSGGFTNTNIYATGPTNNPNQITLYHFPNTNWLTVTDDNLMNDSVWNPTIAQPYRPGGFQWLITNCWQRIGQYPEESNFVVMPEIFTIDSNSTVTITKFGNHGVSRTINGSITNW